MKRIRAKPVMNEFQTLEARRLLSVSAFTPERVLPGTGGPPFAMAVADNGSFMIANGASQKLVVTRFAASGRQLGKQIALSTLAQTFEQSVELRGNRIETLDIVIAILRLQKPMGVRHE